jgi:hypothetical protein
VTLLVTSAASAIDTGCATVVSGAGAVSAIVIDALCTTEIAALVAIRVNVLFA